MATGKIRKVAVLVLVQFGLLVALTLQLHGMVVSYKLLQVRRALLLSAYLDARKSKWSRKRKYLRVRRLCRKPRSVWVANGRTDQWWRNMARTDVPASLWKKNFRMSRECFYSLVTDLDPINFG